MRVFFKYVLADLAALCSVSGPICLLYHRVLPGQQINRGRFFSGLEVNLDLFSEQMEYLSSRRVPVSVDEFVSGLKSGKLSSKAVCVTFDDGYRDNLQYALPVLEKFNIPAVIFVAPALLSGMGLAWWYRLEYFLENLADTGSAELELDLGKFGKRKWMFPTDYKKAVSELNEYCKVSTLIEVEELLNVLGRGQSEQLVQASDVMLTCDEIASLSKHPLITIGTHTLSHVCLTALEEQMARDEVLAGRQRLLDVGVDRVDYFAYPFGGAAQAGDREARIIENCGFQAGFTSLYNWLEPIHDFYMLPRLVISGEDSLGDFCWKVEGGYRIMAWFKRFFKRKHGNLNSG